MTAVWDNAGRALSCDACLYIHCNVGTMRIEVWDALFTAVFSVPTKCIAGTENTALNKYLSSKWVDK